VFVLASGSTRRAELLERLEVEFEIHVADVDESPRDGERPVDLVARLAAAKASVVAKAHPGCIVIGADTVVVVDDEALGKPHLPDAALAMLWRLAGRTHVAMTAVCVIGPDGMRHEAVESAEVDLADVDASVLDWYVSTGEPLDKAGAYALQGVGALLIRSVRGDPTTIIGLPLRTTIGLLRSAGLDWP